MRLGFIFNHLPHTQSTGREGLDAVLATTAFSENICVFFLGDGVLQLKKHQSPDAILSKNYIAAFPLLSLYDVEDIYICQDSLTRYNLTLDDLVISAKICHIKEIKHQLNLCDKLLTF